VSTLPGMPPSSILVSLRIDAAVAALLPRIAEEHGLNEALALEKLIVDKAASLGLVQKDSPGAALVALLVSIRGHLDSTPALAKDPDVTRTVFEWLQRSPRLMKVYEAAIAPPNGVQADKRRQFVHQRVGRFIKDYLGLVSLEEVTLPRGSNSLIRGYTRLGK
jgi:hypothetical protein